jgi:hypothetical protein
VVALVERVAGHRPRRVRHGVLGPAGRQQRDGGLVQRRLHRRRDPVPRHQQPRLEFGAALQLDPVEQFAAGVR